MIECEQMHMEIKNSSFFFTINQQNFSTLSSNTVESSSITLYSMIFWYQRKKIQDDFNETFFSNVLLFQSILNRY
jgi:hypothetical protein